MSNSAAAVLSEPQLVISRPTTVLELRNFRAELRGWWTPLEDRIPGMYWMGQEAAVHITSRSSALLKLSFSFEQCHPQLLSFAAQLGRRPLMSIAGRQISDELGCLQYLYCPVLEGLNRLFFIAAAPSGSTQVLACSFHGLEVVAS